MDFQTITEIDVKDKTILLRVDLNVPRQNNTVSDTTRIERLLPTITYLREQGAKILILSHFGRPEGEQNPEMSLAFLTPILEKCWDCSVQFSPDCIGDVAQDIANSAKSGDVILLENLRFHKGERANDSDFAKSLAALGDIYVNDAFSASHRAHASTTGITQYLPSAAGLLMQEELTALGKSLNTPQTPVLAVAGGSKISTKINLLKNLSKQVDYLVLGGGMANTFLYAQGNSMGRSLCEKDMADTARDIMYAAARVGCEIILPRDVVTVKELKENATYDIVDVNNIADDQMAIDIGPKSIAYISEKIKGSKTVIWNGPMGVFEIKPFDNGTNEIAKIVATQTVEKKCVSIAGGGDTIAALENAGTTADFSYISTAGGAFLEWLEGKGLPGILALSKENPPTKKCRHL
ncbi:MAG: phosphoglycerate kinase [Alphaproteobacteria bacterium]|nr:MAG: phosphoglycerate kinase [Alphaproteobacteria bacterium]